MLHAYRDFGRTPKCVSRGCRVISECAEALSRWALHPCTPHAAKADELCREFGGAERMRDTNIHPTELSNEAIAKLLTDHNVSLNGFGRGRARSFEEFADEVRSGKLRLQLDASRHKHIVCVEDVVCVRLCVTEA